MQPSCSDSKLSLSDVSQHLRDVDLNESCPDRNTVQALAKDNLLPDCVKAVFTMTRSLGYILRIILAYAPLRANFR